MDARRTAPRGHPGRPAGGAAGHGMPGDKIHDAGRSCRVPIWRLVLPVSVTSRAEGASAGMHRQQREDGIHRRRQHDDGHVGERVEAVAPVEADDGRGSIVPEPGQPDRTPIKPSPTMATTVRAPYRAQPRRATGSRQMLRPIAGAMMRSSAISRSNCPGTSTARRRSARDRDRSALR